MIIASTMSEYEARAAVAALASTPPDVGWSVYLGGKLYRERDTSPVSRPDLSWANPVEKR